jgi:hypothetical protein
MEMGSELLKARRLKDDIEEQLVSDKLKGGHKCCRW